MQCANSFRFSVEWLKTKACGVSIGHLCAHTFSNCILNDCLRCECACAFVRSQYSKRSLKRKKQRNEWMECGKEYYAARSSMHEFCFFFNIFSDITHTCTVHTLLSSPVIGRFVCANFIAVLVDENAWIEMIAILKYVESIKSLSMSKMNGRYMFRAWFWIYFILSKLLTESVNTRNTSHNRTIQKFPSDVNNIFEMCRS